MGLIMNGDELKVLREKAGLSQSQLAEKLGYFSKGKPNRSMIARFENGHASINFRISILIKNILGDNNE